MGVNVALDAGADFCLSDGSTIRAALLRGDGLRLCVDGGLPSDGSAAMGMTLLAARRSPGNEACEYILFTAAQVPCASTRVGLPHRSPRFGVGVAHPYRHCFTITFRTCCGAGHGPSPTPKNPLANGTPKLSGREAKLDKYIKSGQAECVITIELY